MSQFLTGSLCFTDLINMAKKGHSAFSKSPKNQKIYISTKMFFNQEPDKYNNNMSFMLNSLKEKAEAEKEANDGKEIYFGNAKIISTGSNSQPVTISDISDDLNDLPF